MKKLVSAMAVIMVTVTFSANAQSYSIQWYNPNLMYDRYGNPMPEDSGCVIRLYTTTDDTISFSIIGGVATPTGDDVWSGLQFSLLSGGDVGLGYANMTPSTLSAGQKIYSVIFSQSPAAGYFAIADNAVQTISYDATKSFTYITDKDVQQSDWKSIPEPATIGLLSLGAGLTLLVSRRKRYS